MTDDLKEWLIKDQKSPIPKRDIEFELKVIASLEKANLYRSLLHMLGYWTLFMFVGALVTPYLSTSLIGHVADAAIILSITGIGLFGLKIINRRWGFL